MNVLDALRDLDLLHSQLKAAPKEIRTLAIWAVGEIDRQNLAARSPGLSATLEAVDAKTMRGIVADNRGSGIPAPSSLASTPNAPRQEPRPGARGWVDPLPLRPPPGIDILDRLMDVEAAKDKAALRKQLP
jgi:hypothetical protein